MNWKKKRGAKMQNRKRPCKKVKPMSEAELLAWVNLKHPEARAAIASDMANMIKRMKSK